MEVHGDLLVADRLERDHADGERAELVASRSGAACPQRVGRRAPGAAQLSGKTARRTPDVEVRARYATGVLAGRPVLRRGGLGERDRRYDVLVAACTELPVGRHGGAAGAQCGQTRGERLLLRAFESAPGVDVSRAAAEVRPQRDVAHEPTAVEGEALRTIRAGECK